MEKRVFAGHAPSFLPEGKSWKLVWNDEFDGTELDTSKWSFRLNFWGERLKTFTTEGVELDGDSHIRLHLLRKGDDFYSPHLQTGALTFDTPRDPARYWPFGKVETPKFMHRYGFYECRCRQPHNTAWHSAFWLQSPCIGAHPDPRRAGVECDIMENYRQFSDGQMICGNLWNGYGPHGCGTGATLVPYVETPDRWHTYAVDWHKAGYDFYMDGKLAAMFVPSEAARQELLASGILDEDHVRISPVSEVEEFILLSTECHGYRGRGFTVQDPDHPKGVPSPELFKAVLPDYFEVDYVRVFDDEALI